MNKVKVSVIIPTRNRKDSLSATIKSIAKLNYPKDQYEIIIVDDGSTDGTDNLVQELKYNLPVTLHYYKQESRGISATKNVAINNSHGTVLAFTDDDCIIEKTWLKKIVKYFNSSKIGAVGGPDKVPSTATLLAKCIDYSVTSFVGTGGVRQGKAVRLAKYYPRGCNMAVPKAVIEKVGGFDETLVAGEDIELVYRIKRAGYLVQYAHDAFVWHQRRNSILSFLKQIFLRGYTRTELVRRHKELLEFSYLIPSLMVVGFIILLGTSFVVPLILKVLFYLSCFYIFILLAAGVEGAMNVRDARALLLIPILLTMQHVTYGIGFLTALFNRKIYAQKNSNS